jgi:DNA-binding CsgD family transcriptional regulator
LQREPDARDAELRAPLRRAMLELASGQRLRRSGQRREAAKQIQAARDLFAGLRALPQLELCDRELAACGLTPAKRSNLDPQRLTPQESAVARLVAQGIGNLQVARELFISIKTVQFHLTHIYTKLGINNRAELAANFRNRVADVSPHRRLSSKTESSPVRRDREPAINTSLARRIVNSGRLTPQESAVARLVAQGMGNLQVAGELFISIKTVQFHLTHIYAKLGINNRAELAAQLHDKS